jgi:hypothetical protein
MKPKQLDPQLSLFPEKTYTVTYWAHPFDENGMYIRTRMELFVDRVHERQLNTFLSFLSIIHCKYVKYS